MDADLVPTVAVGKLPTGDTTDCIKSLIAMALVSPERLGRMARPGSRVMVIADFGPLYRSEQPDLYLRALTGSVRFLRNRGATVSVGDSPALDGLKTGWLYRRLGLPDIARRCGFKLTNFELSRLDLRLVESRLYMIPRPVLEADLIINVADASLSLELGVRGALANLAGAVPGMRHRVALLAKSNPALAGERLADILTLVPPILNVVLYSNDLHLDHIVVTTDAVAADAVIAARYGVAGPDLPLVRTAAGAGLGIGHVEAVKCLGDKEIIGAARGSSARLTNRATPRKSSSWRPVDHSIPRIDPSLCVYCGICEVTCPARAIQARSGREKPSIDGKRCQSCLCCHEVCPSGAISYLTPRARG